MQTNFEVGLKSLVFKFEAVLCFKGTVHPKMEMISLITHPHDIFDGICSIWRVRKLSDFIKNILICVLKMNEGLTGLERQEFSFLGELSL